MKHLVIGLALAGAACGALAQGSEAGRAAKRAEIDFYTTKYIGDDVAYENVGCGTLAFPAESVTRDEVRAVGRKMEAWRECYNRYVERIQALTGPGKNIPADLQRLMTREELDKANQRMANVLDAVAGDAADVAQQVTAAYDAWSKRTVARLELESSRSKQNETLMTQMNRDENLDSSRQVNRTRTPTR